MKNSDMKVIAIILSIALFFTIVTSNAVSIASVVFLAKGQTATEGTVDASGDATNTDANANNNANTNTNTDTNSTVTPETTAPAADANTNTDANANANANNNAETTAPAGDANKPADDANKPAAPAAKIDKEALAMFQKAAKEINSKGVAGYSYKSWQAIESINLGGNDSLKGLIEGFLTKEADAEVKVQAKGSEDAMRRMPISNCSESTVESVTKTASGSNVVVTIVMKDSLNPGKEDKDGLNVMSRDFLYMEDVKNTIQNDSAVKALVWGLDRGEINYKAYTITATMTKDGKFVEITHKCSAELAADVKLALNIPLSGNGVLQFNVKYWDFKY